MFELVRRKRLSERYAILWLLAAATLFVLAAWKGLLTTLSHDVGIHYPPSALFAVAFGLIALLLLHFSLVVSRLTDQNKVLAQRLGLLQHRLEEQVRWRPKPMPPRWTRTVGAQSSRRASRARLLRPKSSPAAAERPVPTRTRSPSWS